jgi:hypothetical protein
MPPPGHRDEHGPLQVDAQRAHPSRCRAAKARGWPTLRVRAAHAAAPAMDAKGRVIDANTFGGADWGGLWVQGQADGFACLLHPAQVPTFTDNRLDGGFPILVGFLDENLSTFPDRVIFMDGGEIIEENPPLEFFTNPRSDRTKLFLSQILHH